MDRPIAGRWPSMAGICTSPAGRPPRLVGVSLVESGFQLRPRIISLTPGTTAGTHLNGGGTYSYRVHQEWTDSRGDLHLSPPSAITKVTLGTGDNRVTAVCSGPH